MKEFLAWVKVEHKSKPNTVRSYLSTSEALTKYFGNSKIDKIHSGKVESFKKWRSNQKRKPRRAIEKKNGSTAAESESNKPKKTRKPLAPATINRELALLKIFFNHCIKKEFIVKNPVSDVKLLKEETPPIRVLTVEEERLYLLAASQPLQDIASIMIDTGMRPEEIFRMKREDIHIPEGDVFNPSGKSRFAKRNIPLTRRAISILDARVRASTKEYLFLTKQTGKPITTLKTAHASTIATSKVEKFRLYDLRHTFATRFVESGGDLMTLKEILGHANIQMVSRYAHPTEKHKFDAIRKMEEIRLSKSGKTKKKSA